MDEKLNAVLSNSELMEKIAALVKGTTPPPEDIPEPATPVQSFVPATGSMDKGLALLNALRPFLKESRRRKLDSAAGALSVASLYSGIKKL